MAKNKDVRVTITLECTNCAQNNEKKKLVVSRYTTKKNSRNTPIRLELKKFCSYFNNHTIHKKIKK